MIKTLSISLTVILLVFASADSYARNWFANASDSGITGIFVTPTARLQDEDDYVMGFSQAYPYRSYYFGVGLYDRLEVSARVTEVLDFKMGEHEGDSDYWGGYGNFKDKFVAGKFLLSKEGKYLPAVAVGLDDPMGTKVFGGQYLVMSKQIYPFDFTLGLGLGRYGEKELRRYTNKKILTNFINPREYMENGNVFYSVQFRPSEKFALLYEYNPIEYETQTLDPAARIDLNDKKTSHNFGLRYYFSDHVYASASWQKGTEYGVNLTFPFTLGQPLIPIYDKELSLPSLVDRMPADGRIAQVLLRTSYVPHSIYIEDRTAYLKVHNNRYYYIEDSIGRLAEDLHKVMQDDVDSFVIIYSKDDMPYANATLSRQLINSYVEGKIDKETLVEKSSLKYEDYDMVFNYPTIRLKLFYGIKPELNFLFNDPGGFLKGSMGLRAWAGYNVTEKISTLAGLSYYPVNNISSANEQIDDPVRTDGVLYHDNSVGLDMLMGQYVNRIDPLDTYYNIELGLLETQYAGVNFDVGRAFNNGNLILGASSSVVVKRDEDSYWNVKNTGKKYHTAFLKSRIHVNSLSSYVDLKAGRFLAGDIGLRTEVTKNINGVLLTAWYTKTDTSVFDDSVNRGASDVGVKVTVPIRFFTGKESRSSYSQSVQAWTKDVGADVGEFTNILNYIDRKKEKKY